MLKYLKELILKQEYKDAVKEEYRNLPFYEAEQKMEENIRMMVSLREKLSELEQKRQGNNGNNIHNQSASSSY